MFVFIIDNSMQWAGSISALDASKHAVESFLAAAPCLGSSLQLMLLQTGQGEDGQGGEGDDCLLSSFGDPVSVFREGLKTIQQRDRSDTCDYSYPLSYALSVINTYRLKSGADTFGHGRAMWLIEPVNIVVFSDGRATAKSEVRLKCRGDCPFVGPPLRWDHRVSLVLVSKDPPSPADTDAPQSLAALCKASQGETMQIRDMKEASTVLRAFSPKPGPYRSLLTVGVNLRNVSAGPAPHTPHPKGEEGVVAVRLIPTDTPPPEGYMCVRWPVPENYWVDPNVDKFPPRDSFPSLLVYRSPPTPVDTSAGEVVGSPDYFLGLAKELRIYAETFELAPPPNAPLSVKRALGVKSQEKCHVSAQGSGRPSSADSSASVGSALLISHANMKANAINGLGLAVPPFAILLPNSKTPGSCELRVLPFNYPVFLPMVHRAVEAIKKHQASALPSVPLSSQPWVAKYQEELTAYMHSVPSYAYPAVIETLRHLGLKTQLRDDKIHKVPFKRIQALKGAAIVEIASLQAAARRKWPVFVPSPMEVALASCEPSRRVALPQAVSEVQPRDMLAVYESMRRVIFGGSRGRTASRLGLAGAHSAWLVGAIGGGGACQRSVADMGNFYEVLARKEALRDPLTLDAPPDEDSPEGLMNRKTKVNFGNRFKGEKEGTGGGMGGVGGMEIETSTGVRIVGADEEERALEVIDPSTFFMDTPFPAADEEDGALCYSPLTDREGRETDCVGGRENEWDMLEGADDWSQVPGGEDEQDEEDKEGETRSRVRDPYQNDRRSISNSTSKRSSGSNDNSGSSCSSGGGSAGIADTTDAPRTQRKLSLTPTLSAPSPSLVLALPPLGRPFAAVNGKRKREREREAGIWGAGKAEGGRIEGGRKEPAVVSLLGGAEGGAREGGALKGEVSSSSSSSGSGSSGEGEGVSWSVDDDVTVTTKSSVSKSSASSKDSVTGTKGGVSSTGGRSSLVVPVDSQVWEVVSETPTPTAPSSTSSFQSSSSSSPSTSPSPQSSSSPSPSPAIDYPPPPPPPAELPPGWVMKFSGKHQTDYWFNLHTGQSVWQKPKS